MDICTHMFLHALGTAPRVTHPLEGLRGKELQL